MGTSMNRRLSTKLSWLLRHGAHEEGLKVDPAGWVAIEEVLELLSLTRAQLDAVVLENNKRRYEIDGERVRASQGHSMATMPVTQDALEASWRRVDALERVWHGTHLEAVDAIAREGIKRGARTHVHMARELESRVGKRANVHVMLEVSVRALESLGYALFESSNGVLLTRFVPPAAMVGCVPMTRRAKAQREALERLFMRS